MSEAFRFGSTVALVYSLSKIHVAPRCFFFTHIYP